VGEGRIERARGAAADGPGDRAGVRVRVDGVGEAWVDEAWVDEAWVDEAWVGEAWVDEAWVGGFRGGAVARFGGMARVRDEAVVGDDAPSGGVALPGGRAGGREPRAASASTHAVTPAQIRTRWPPTAAAARRTASSPRTVYRPGGPPTSFIGRRRPSADGARRRGPHGRQV
jgi:hypothetical protein